jgi:O-succinylhomoserine sulfhydrylase
LIEKIKEYSFEKETSFSLLNTWLLERGLETLAVRMERQSSNALRVAEYLEKNKVIHNVVYPFLPSYTEYKLALKQMRYGGCILSFSMEGGVVRGRRFMQSLKKFSNPNQASIRTTILHPASTTHYSLPDKMRLQLGARSNLILLSVGMEHIDDILHHIDQAITNSKIELKLCSRYEE